MTQAPRTKILGIGLGYDTHVDRVMVGGLEDLLQELRQPYEKNDKKHWIKLPNGSQMYFGSQENVLTLEGPHLPYAWIDEGGQMGYDAWRVATRRTGMVGGQILITTIPWQEGWLKTDVHDAFLRGDPDVDYIHLTTLDNPRYSRRELRRIKDSVPEDVWEREYLGLWVKKRGVIFREPMNDADIVVDLDKEFAWNTCPCCFGAIPHSWPTLAGHDWGFNNPTAGVWARLSPDDVLYIVADYERNEMTMEDHVVEWRRLGLDVVDQAFGDPSAVEQWAVADRLGYTIEGVENDNLYGIGAVQRRLKSGRLKVARGCQRWFDCRNSYVWASDPKDERKLLDRPLPNQPSSHVMDATRYLVVGVDMLTEVLGYKSHVAVDARARRPLGLAS